MARYTSGEGRLISPHGFIIGAREPHGDDGGSSLAQPAGRLAGSHIITLNLEAPCQDEPGLGCEITRA